MYKNNYGASKKQQLKNSHFEKKTKYSNLTIVLN